MSDDEGGGVTAPAGPRDADGAPRCICDEPGQPHDAQCPAGADLSTPAALPAPAVPDGEADRCVVCSAGSPRHGGLCCLHRYDEQPACATCPAPAVPGDAGTGCPCGCALCGPVKCPRCHEGETPPAPVAEPAETRVGRAALDAYEAIPYDNDLSRADVHALIGRAVLAALPAPAAPGDAERRPPYTGSAADSWVVGYQDGREDEAKAWQRNATLAADGDLLTNAAEVASLRRSLADAEAKVAAVEALRAKVALLRESAERSLSEHAPNEASVLRGIETDLTAALAGAGTDEGTQG